VKRRHYSWLTQSLCLAPLACGLAAGCQELVHSSFVLLQPPAIMLAEADNEEPESIPTLGPGNRGSTPSRVAQPTLFSSPRVKPASAAPGPMNPAQTARTLLLKATAALEARNTGAAAAHLRRYVEIYPDAVLIRMQLGELYFEQQRWGEAASEFQLALGEVVEPGLPIHCRLHAHSRLMELASERNDSYQEELHRGIGLVLLAEHRQTQKQNDEMVSAAQLFGKARNALVKASEARTQDARPALYLVSVWQGMQQHANALAALEKAQLLSHLTSLSAYERLQLATWSIVLP
jgi:tetratricopeptide (TPR) repeat protein